MRIAMLVILLVAIIGLGAGAVVSLYFNADAFHVKVDDKIYQCREVR